MNIPFQHLFKINALAFLGWCSQRTSVDFIQLRFNALALISLQIRSVCFILLSGRFGYVLLGPEHVINAGVFSFDPHKKRSSLVELIAYMEGATELLVQSIPLLDQTFSLYANARRSLHQARSIVYLGISWYGYFLYNI
jgi:hypothetical protein